MPGYTKLFSSIVSSTVWNEDDGTRLLWVTMLAICDGDGLVEASVPGLAHQARISVDKARAGLKKLESPDPDSRTPDNEGRRVEKVNGGWRILNYEMYREKRSPDELREKSRLRTQRWRERHKLCNVTVTPVTPCDAVTSRNVTVRHADADADAVLIPPTPLSKGGNVTLQNQERNPQTRKCMMPGCNHPARAGLPGTAQMFCSEVCLDAAKRLDPENFKRVKV